MEKWIEDKNRRIEIFEDTESWYNTDPALQDAMKRSIDGTKFYFASATHPGGGVRNGSTAQEEALCRCTTLLPCLTIYDLSRKYYDFHRKLDFLR